MQDFTLEIETYVSRLKKVLDALDKESINTLMNLLLEARKHKKKIFIMGNGGSASTASHYCCDFNKGLSYTYDEKFKFICLNDNLPTLMAYANDVGYEYVFEEQLKNFLQAGDYVIGISGSGNSKNVVRALEYANQHEGVSIALTGFDGGKMKQIARYNVHVPVHDMQIAEDVHMILDHLMMKVLSSIQHKV